MKELVVEVHHGTPFTLSYKGGAWIAMDGETENPDVTVANSAKAWTTFLTVRRDERKKLADTLHTSGAPECIKEFLHTFGVREETPRSR